MQPQTANICYHPETDRYTIVRAVHSANVMRKCDIAIISPFLYADRTHFIICDFFFLDLAELQSAGKSNLFNRLKDKLAYIYLNKFK